VPGVAPFVAISNGRELCGIATDRIAYCATKQRHSGVGQPFDPFTRVPGQPWRRRHWATVAEDSESQYYPPSSHTEEPVMASASLKNQQRIISNQKTIVRNQSKILRSLQAVVKNQKKILSNQSKILAK
jgi:hypothetical protein